MFAASSLQALNRDFTIYPGHDNLLVFSCGLLVHCKQVTIHNAHINHALALDTQKIVSVRVEAAGWHLLIVLNILLSQYGLTGCNAANNRNTIKLLDNTNASRGAGNHLDHSLASQGAQMVLRGIGRAKAQCLSDLCSGGRIACLIQIIFYQIKYLLLSGGKTFHKLFLCSYACNYIQYS